MIEFNQNIPLKEPKKALKIKNKLLFGTIGIFTIFGILFAGLLVHEGVHVLQSKAPESICYDMQQASWMHTEGNKENNDYLKLGGYDYNPKEKIAYVIQWVFIISLSMFTGGFWLYTYKYKK